MMRFGSRARSVYRLVVVLLFAAVSCQRSSAQDSAGDMGPAPAADAGASGGDFAQDGAPPSAPGECAVAADCVPAASTCCDCATFSVPASSGYEEGCAEVMCPENPECPPVETVCAAGQCELRCAQVVTARECELGFERSPAGCLLDQCATAEDGAPECSDDLDCEQVKADCCGCARGGADIALPVEEVADHLDSLQCAPAPSCPEVNVCDSGAQARCVVGMCRLLGGADDMDDPPSPQLCGAPSTTACPQDQVCVLNHPDSPNAADLGVGSCHTP